MHGWMHCGHIGLLPTLIKILLVDHYDPKPIGDEIGYSIQIALIKDRVCYTKIISI